MHTISNTALSACKYIIPLCNGFVKRLQPLFEK
nr:MAG TPA: hypothetical protein [Caudoviricetes sp.]